MAKQDDRNTTADYYVLSTDESTVLRHEQIRLRETVYSGTMDADSSTDINLVGIPIDAEVVSAVFMVQDNATTTLWRVTDNEDANTAARAFRAVWVRTAGGQRIFRVSDVGAQNQSTPFRLWIKWAERL